MSYTVDDKEGDTNSCNRLAELVAAANGTNDRSKPLRFAAAAFFYAARFAPKFGLPLRRMPLLAANAAAGRSFIA